MSDAPTDGSTNTIDAVILFQIDRVAERLNLSLKVERERDTVTGDTKNEIIELIELIGTNFLSEEKLWIRMSFSIVSDEAEKKSGQRREE